MYLLSVLYSCFICDQARQSLDSSQEFHFCVLCMQELTTHCHTASTIQHSITEIKLRFSSSTFHMNPVQLSSPSLDNEVVVLS